MKKSFLRLETQFINISSPAKSNIISIRIQKAGVDSEVDACFLRKGKKDVSTTINFLDYIKWKDILGHCIIWRNSCHAYVIVYV